MAKFRVTTDQGTFEITTEGNVSEEQIMQELQTQGFQAPTPDPVGQVAEAIPSLLPGIPQPQPTLAGVAGEATRAAVAPFLPTQATAALQTPQGLGEAAKLAPIAGAAAGSLVSPVVGTALGATGGTAIRDVILAALGDESAPETTGESLGNQLLTGAATLATGGVLKGGGATVRAVGKAVKIIKAPGTAQAGKAVEEALTAGGAKPGGLPSTPADLAQFAQAAQTRLRQQGVTTPEVQEIREIITRTFEKSTGDVSQALGRTRVTADKLIRERVPSVGPVLDRFREAKSRESILQTGRKLGKRVVIGASIGAIQAIILGSILRGLLQRGD